MNTCLQRRVQSRYSLAQFGIPLDFLVQTAEARLSGQLLRQIESITLNGGELVGMIECGEFFHGVALLLVQPLQAVLAEQQCQIHIEHLLVDFLHADDVRVVAANSCLR